MSLFLKENPTKRSSKSITQFLMILLISVCVGCISNLIEYEDSTYSGLDDERNEKLALKNIKSVLSSLQGTNIHVKSFKGTVLITGQVVSQDYISLATNAVESMRNVAAVHNELVIAGPTSIISRTNDAYLSSKIRAKLVASKDIDAKRIRVVTENGVAYLMGHVTQQESEIVVDEAKQVYGIQKIIKVFEYLN